ncbi:MAG: YgaP-like transmembrane domain [Halodesulfurarchaeum sp.]
MNVNVGDTDQTIRLALGLLALVLGAVTVLGQMVWRPAFGLVLLAVAAVLLVTGGTQKCLLYGLLGVDTRKR